MRPPQSGHDENPYASPRVPAPLVAAGRGAGVWRDGSLFVMHEFAALPPYCVKTGMPARYMAYVRAPWLCESFRLYIDAPQIAVPLAQRWRSVAARLRLVSLIVAFGGYYFGMLTEQLLGKLPGRPMGVAASLVGGAISLALVIAIFVIGDPLKHDHTEGPYHWLKGASPEFLKRLPEWPPDE